MFDYSKEKTAQTLDARQFIPQLAEQITNDTKGLSINYISLTRACNGILRGLKETGKIEIDKRAWHPSSTHIRGDQNFSGDPAHDMQVLHYVKEILWEEKDWEQVNALLYKQVTEGRKILLRKNYIGFAGEWCQEFMRKQGLLVGDGAANPLGEKSTGNSKVGDSEHVPAKKPKRKKR